MDNLFLQNEKDNWMIWFFRILLTLSFLVLLGRTVDLQLIRGKYFRSLSEENRIRRVPISARRGNILAKDGELLVGSSEEKRRVVFDSREGFVKDDNVREIPEQDLIVEWRRAYLLGGAFAHLSGYLGETTPEEVGKVEARCTDKGVMTIGQWVGRSGLEQEYDCVLRGIDGEQLIEVNALGEKVRSLGQKYPVSGDDLSTTIDYGLQKEISTLFSDLKGGVVVTNAKGEVLALYSSPSYDPNSFVALKKDVGVLSDPNLPLLNRIISGKYHPGSVYKPIVATSALEEGSIDADFRYEDTGSIVIDSAYGSYSYTNWFYTQYGGVEGNIDLTRAIARSTDTFFYKLGELTGIEDIAKWSNSFGLSKKTGIDLPGEIKGLVPDSNWKQEVKGERWFLGNTYHVSIGQGDLAQTPIEINTAISAIANGGNLCVPHLKSDAVESCIDLNLKAKNTEIIKEGMTGACSTGGTAYTFFDFQEKTNISVACKTGTAQSENGEPHAWFVAFAPVGQPKIIATVLVENGGEGSKVAGPIARSIFDYWSAHMNKE